jgi:hypothetical protein
VAIGYRDSLSLPKTYSSEFGIQRSGRSMARARGKNLSIRLSIPASETWTFARGVDAIEFQQGGVR